jgi:hypothetical protein
MVFFSLFGKYFIASHANIFSPSFSRYLATLFPEIRKLLSVVLCRNLGDISESVHHRRGEK